MSVLSLCRLTKKVHYIASNKGFMQFSALASRHLTTMTKEQVKETFDNIIISARDDRHYRGLQLHNGMKIMLISDPQTEKASAAMNVSIGHMKDPKHIPGLAHFLEHMLFLGTKKYPEENAYLKYLAHNGGSSNAFTSGEHTNFYFDVAAENLSGALDRFAQFFLEPLFTSSATEREINAVNSENDKNLQSDSWRFHQLDRSLSNPSHDFNNFGTGNKFTLETRPKQLGCDVREELLKFHAENYSSNLMGLTVLGKETLNELTDLVVPLFSGVENKNVTMMNWPDHPFGPEQLKTICFVTPVKDIRNMNVTWSIPDLHEYYKTDPGHYLGHLIGHEGKGSLLSELKQKGWVNTLMGGQQRGAKGFMFFMVNVDLTEDGLEHYEDILTLIYQYIHLLRKEGPKEWIFNECRDISAMLFRFKDKERPRMYTSSLSGMLHDYPMEEVLCAHYLHDQYRPELIEDVLKLLVPDNMRVSVVAKKFDGQTTTKEEWYGTEYKLEKIPAEKLQAFQDCGLNENLHLPERNEFIPTNFEIVPRETESSAFPTIIRDTGMTRLWFKQDDKFLMPKSFANFEISSPMVYIDPLHSNLAFLFVQLCKDALNEYSYNAELAGLKFTLASTPYGISLGIRGYSDKLDVFLDKILEKILTFELDPKRFEIMKELYGRSLRNFNAEQPHQHAVYFTSVLMSEIMWTKEELTSSLEEVTLEKLKLFIPQMFSKLYIEGLIYGNITKQRAEKMMKSVEDILQGNVCTKELLPSQRRRLREIQLPDGCYYLYQKTNSVHKSSSIEIYYQCGQQSTNMNMLLELLVQVISEPCFDILRTKEQLGYIVFSGIRRQSGVQGLRVIVQSDRSPEFLEGRIEAFLDNMKDTIRDMSEEDFQTHVSALCTKRLDKPKKLAEQFVQYWSEIMSKQYNFDRDNIEVAFLKTVTREDLYKFYADTICSDAPKRHKLSVHVMSTAPIQGDQQDQKEMVSSEKSTIDPSKAVIVQDVNEFKRDMALYPLAKPYIDLLKAQSKL